MSLANELIAMGILKATEKPSEIQTVYAYSNPLSLSEYGAYTPIRLRSETRMTVNADLERNKPRD